MKKIISYHLFIICMFFPILGSAQLIIVTGTIINQKTENTLENVSVFELNSGIGTITNVNGFYSLMLKPGKAEFVISREGYNDLSRKMLLERDSTLTLSLVPVINLKTKIKETEQQKTVSKLDKGRN